MEQWRVSKAVVADLHRYYEEQDPDPHQSGKRIRIRIRVKSRIKVKTGVRTRISIKGIADPEHWLVCQLSLALA